MNPEILSKAVPNMPLARAQKWAAGLTQALVEGKIVGLKPVAAFLAQTGHESLSFAWVYERGNAAYFEKYDSGPIAKRLGNTPDKDGDGELYKGRGLIQITGHDNYLACSKALFGDARLLESPELLEQPGWACRSAVWFWNSRGLTALANNDQFDLITKRINGGDNGSEDRRNRYKQAIKVLA